LVVIELGRVVVQPDVDVATGLVVAVAVGALAVVDVAVGLLVAVALAVGDGETGVRVAVKGMDGAVGVDDEADVTVADGIGLVVAVE